MRFKGLLLLARILIAKPAPTPGSSPRGMLLRNSRWKSKSDRVDHLIHGGCRLGAAGLADNLGGNPRYRHVVRHGLHHHGASGDAGTMADLDIAENLRACPDQYAVADFGMAVLVLLAGAAKRDAVQDRDVVFDHSGLADDDSGGVIEEATPANPGR